MSRLFRVRAWCLATAMSLAVGTAGASFDALLHGGDVHDACCTPRSAVEHDEAAHRYQPSGGAPLSPGHHCLACHWARSFRLDSGPAAVTARLDDAGGYATIRTIGRPAAAALTGLPARSPPRFS